MSSSLQPRGPLPPRVYWIRRLLVIAVVVLLVVVVAKLLGSGSDGDPGADGQATTVSSEADEAATQAPGTGPREKGARDKGKRKKKPVRLARPDGPCDDSDVLVEPVVAKTPEAGRDVRIRLELRTQEAAACTWQVSSDSVAVTITSGDDDIWTSRECPKVIPTEDVVVRRAKATTVPIVWNARRSDDECSVYTDWAMAGWYHVETAAYAGEPADVQFEMVRPVSATITKTITPKPKPKKTEKTEKAEKADDESRQHRAADDGGGNSEG